MFLECQQLFAVIQKQVPYLPHSECQKLLFHRILLPCIFGSN